MLFTCGHVTEQTKNIESGYLILAVSSISLCECSYPWYMYRIIGSDDNNWNFKHAFIG